MYGNKYDHLWYYFMILCTMKIVAYTSIICMILVYDSPHYEWHERVCYVVCCVPHGCMSFACVHVYVWVLHACACMRLILPPIDMFICHASLKCCMQELRENSPMHVKVLVFCSSPMHACIPINMFINTIFLRKRAHYFWKKSSGTHHLLLPWLMIFLLTCILTGRRG